MADDSSLAHVRKDKNTKKTRKGLFFLILVLADIILGVILGWHLLGPMDTLLVYIQAITGIIGAICPIIFFIFKLGRQLSIVDILQRAESNIMVMTGALLIFFALLVLTFWPAPNANIQATFDFESKTNEGWDIRYEGANLLGISASPDDGHHYGSGRWSLGFHFVLGNPPFQKAQIKYQAANLELTELLSGWIYLPANKPSDIQVNCFILEDNTTKKWANKPDWPWYETKPATLQPGKWTQITCPASDFVANYPSGHWDQPLLLGFSFSRASSDSLDGTVYLDKIILR